MAVWFYSAPEATQIALFWPSCYKRDAMCVAGGAGVNFGSGRGVGITAVQREFAPTVCHRNRGAETQGKPTVPQCV